MRCVQELRGRFGKGMVVDVLRGSQNAKLLDMHLDEAACYDTVNAPAAQVKEVIELLAAGGYLLITEGRTRWWVWGRVPARLPKRVSACR